MMSNNHKGAVAELAIATAAVTLGVPVYKPLSEHSRADLGFEIGPQLMRVQCKWARLSGRRDVEIVHTAGTRLSTRGDIRTPYSEADVDLLDADCAELGRAFLL